MKYIYITTLLIISCNITHSQSYIKDNIDAHSYDAKIIELSYFITKLGVGIEGVYSKTSMNGLINEYVLSFDNGEFSKTKTDYKIYAIQYNKLKTIYNNDNKTFFFNVGAGGYLSYENMKNDLLNVDKKKFSPGILGKIEVEYYVKKIGFSLNAQQLYKPISEIGELQWKLGAGIKYIIN